MQIIFFWNCYLLQEFDIEKGWWVLVSVRALTLPQTLRGWKVMPKQTFNSHLPPKFYLLCVWSRTKYIDWHQQLNWNPSPNPKPYGRVKPSLHLKVCCHHTCLWPSIATSAAGLLPTQCCLSTLWGWRCMVNGRPYSKVFLEMGGLSWIWWTLHCKGPFVK